MKYSYPLVLLASVLALSACNKNTTTAATAKDDVVLATVDGKNIGTSEFNTFVTLAAGSSVDKLTAEQKKQLLDRLVGVHLAAAAAEKAKLESQPETANLLNLWRTNLLSDAQLKKYLAEHPITDDELKAEYDTQVAAMPRQYHARHILVESKETADAIIKDLKGGADFAKIAKEKSKDPGSAKNGGDLDWFTLDSMVKPFGDAVAQLENGQVTQEPVQTQYGWHVIKLEESRTQAAPAFADVKTQVNQLVQSKKIESYLAELRKTAKVEIKEDALKAETPASAAAASIPAEPAAGK